jgi:hypothetical protein
LRIRFALVLSALVLVAQAFGPALAASHTSFSDRFLSSSYYTNGVTKTIVGGTSHSGCGKYADISLTVYYNKLDTTGMNVTKVVVKYYLKPNGGVWGGSLIVTKANNTQSYLPPGNTLGDYYTFYPFNSATKNSEGYSLVGTYTHNGPLWSGGRVIAFTKYNSIGCGTESPRTVVQFHW